MHINLRVRTLCDWIDMVRPSQNFDTWLTAPERDILSLIEQGRTPEDIAVALGLALRTVSLHIQRIAAKFQARNMASPSGTSL